MTQSFYDLPTSLNVNGRDYLIRSDWRTGLDCLEALNDIELSDVDKALVVIGMLYREEVRAADISEALTQAMRYLCGGQEDKCRPSPKLMDWQQDARFIFPAVNRVAGREIRADLTMHWWTFLGYYYEIGDGTFAQIVHVRNQIARGRRLDKSDAMWYRDNRRIVDFKQRYTDSEKQWFKEMGV